MRWVKSRSKASERPEGWGPEYFLKDGKKTILMLWWVSKQEDDPERDWGWRASFDAPWTNCDFWIRDRPASVAEAQDKAVKQALGMIGDMVGECSSIYSQVRGFQRKRRFGSE
jgi:hypothetical protein